MIRFVAALAIFDAGLIALTEAQLGGVALGAAGLGVAAMFVTDRWWSTKVPAPRGECPNA